MDKKLEKELSAYIVKELLGSRDRDEIITEVCHRADCLWVEGEYLLERTERENRQLLREQKSPIRMFISVFAAAVGLAWALISIIRITAPLVRYRLAGSQNLQGYAWPAETAGLVIQTVLGLAMVVTGMILTLQQIKTIHR